jgi:hydroxyacylglutathione hydrolase
MSASETVSISKEEGNVVVDTRERTPFMNAHLKGSLLATLNKSFNTVVGSYVEEDEVIYLVVDEQDLEEAVRDLIRIGLDNIAGYVPTSELEKHLEEEETPEMIETIDFKKTAELMEEGPYRALDVRKATEYDEGHVKGAVNIAHTRLLERENELDKEKTWLVYCRTGARASVASALLKRDGFNIKYIDDLIDNWAEKVTT